MSVPPELRQYRVFISSAGEDKATMAIPLQQKLEAMGISSYIDPPHTRQDKEAPTALTVAMETSPIAVVILSPESVARRWPMREILCFLRRHQYSIDRKTTPFTLFTLYYRLRTTDLFDEPRLDRPDIYGRQLYSEAKFYERMTHKEPEASIAGIKVAMRDIRFAPGLDNLIKAKNDDTEEMRQKREDLLNDVAERVKNIIPGEPIPEKKEDYIQYCY